MSEGVVGFIKGDRGQFKSSCDINDVFREGMLLSQVPSEEMRNIITSFPFCKHALGATINEFVLDFGLEGRCEVGIVAPGLNLDVKTYLKNILPFIKRLAEYVQWNVL
jgi:hypothetical protein